MKNTRSLEEKLDLDTTQNSRKEQNVTTTNATTYYDGPLTRGDIVIVKPNVINFKSNHPSVQGKSRAAVIVQNNDDDAGNSINSSTIIVAVISKWAQQPLLPTHVKNIKVKIASKTLDVSPILCEQLFTIDKKDIIEKVAHISTRDFERLDEALKISLGLTPVITRDEDPIIKEAISLTTKIEQIAFEIKTLESETDKKCMEMKQKLRELEDKKSELHRIIANSSSSEKEEKGNEEDRNTFLSDKNIVSYYMNHTLQKTVEHFGITVAAVMSAAKRLGFKKYKSHKYKW